ncbi:MAG: hypothetical protein ABIJ59_15220 [Pseudomonadota bacterium]
MKSVYLILISALMLVWVETLWSYPMDGYGHTGISRLEGLLQVSQGKISGPKRVAGAKLAINQVDLRLTQLKSFTMPAPDPDLVARIQALLGEDADNYGIAVLDMTDTKAPRYAAIKGSYKANPGSVGKLVVALGIFQTLADIYPDDTEKRLNILRSTMIRADAFIQADHHKVPFWSPGQSHIQYRPILQGDEASLFTYLDWMMSASSNAAAAMVQKQLVLMVRFGRDYPVTEAAAEAFFKETPKKELGEGFAKGIQETVLRNGLDLDAFRQGSFFTWGGKKKVPGTTSYATPEALVQFLLKLEQGQLVDSFSSREIKRLLYMTGKRIRYASSPALYSSAVYFKSGSLYKCKPELGFECEKYIGNLLNQLCSVAIVEHPVSQPVLHYMVAVMSNVLYKNSAVAHQTFATRLHRLMEKDYAERLANSGKGLRKDREDTEKK